MRTSRWQRFRADVLESYSPPLYPPHTLFAVRRVLDVLDGLGVRSPADLTPELVGRFVTRPLARETIRGQVAYLRVFVGRLLRDGALRRDPFLARTRWLPPMDPPRRKHLGSSEIGLILSQCSSEALSGAWKDLRMRALIYSLAYTGARKSEILGLRLADYDPHDQVITIAPNPSRRLKTVSSEGSLPVCSALAGALDPWLTQVGSEWLIPRIDRRGPWLEGGPGHSPLEQLRALGRRAGVARATFAGFRHGYATRCAAQALPPSFTSRMLRHTSPATAERWYVARDVEALRDNAERISFGDASQSRTLPSVQQF